MSLQKRETDHVGAGGGSDQHKQVIAMGRGRGSAPPPLGSRDPGSNHLHCRRAQKTPVFLLMVDASELATMNCPCAVHSTEGGGERKKEKSAFSVGVTSVTHHPHE